MKLIETPVLTTRQARFVEEYLVDGNGTQAAVRAGYSGARLASYRLLRNEAICSLIETRRQADATRLSIDRNNVLTGLLEAIAMAREQQNPAGMIAGLREVAKLQGYYAPVATKVAVDLGAEVMRRRIEALSDAELLRVIEQCGAPS